MKKLYLAMALFCFSTSSMASGYAGIGIGTVDVAEDVSSFDSTVGFELMVGTEINPNISVEASYVDFGEADDGVPPEWHASASTLAFGVLAKAPVNEQVEVFFKVGLHLWNVEVSEDGFGVFVDDDGTDLFFGFGASMEVNNQISVDARYTSYDFGTVDLDLLTHNALG